MHDPDLAYRDEYSQKYDPDEARVEIELEMGDDRISQSDTRTTS